MVEGCDYLTISIKTKATITISYVIVMVFLLASIVYYVGISKYAANRIDNQALKISEAGRHLVDGDAFERAVLSKEQDNESYREIQTVLNILGYLVDANRLFAGPVEGQKVIYLSDNFKIHSMLAYREFILQREDEIFETLSKGDTYYIRLDSKIQKKGRLQGALIPINNSKGKLVGVVGYEVEQGYYEHLEFIKWIIILATGITAMICIFLNYLGVKILLKPINELVEAFNKIATGDLRIALNLNRNDEIGKINREVVRGCERVGKIFKAIISSSFQLRLIAEKILHASMKNLIAFEEVANSTKEISLISYEQMDKREAAKLAVTYLEEDVRIILVGINKAEKDYKVSKEIIEQMAVHVSTIKNKLYELDHVFEIIDKHTVNLVAVTERQVASSEEFTATAEKLNEEAEKLSKSIAKVKS